MLSPHVAEGYQIPLFHEVHADDEYLLNTIDGEWFEILHHFAWADCRVHAAAYYDALYAFNIDQGEAPKRAGETTPETKTAAQQRLLFDRTTMQPPETVPQILYQGQAIEWKAPTVNPMVLALGVVPVRLAGRQPKCFFWFIQKFSGDRLNGFPHGA